REQIDDARGVLLGVELEAQVLVGIERRQVVEEDLLARLLRLLEVDGLDLEQREVALAFLGGADLSGDHVAGAQVEAADLARRDVDIVGTGEVVESGARRKPKPSGRISSTPSPQMKPFCSVCACRIEKMSSCFRRAAAPSMLISFAIAASSPIFLSFNDFRLSAAGSSACAGSASGVSAFARARTPPSPADRSL